MFDYESAKQYYSDSEIADFLGSQSNFDVQGARNAGYGDSDIINLLNKQKTAEQPQENKGIVGNIGDAIVGSLDKSQEIMSNPKLSEAEKRIGYAGQGLGMIGNVGGAIVGGVAKTAWNLAPDFITKPFEIAAEGISEQISPTLRATKEKYNQWEQENPRKANIVNATGNAVGAGLTLASIKPTAKMITSTAKEVPKAYQYAKNAITTNKTIDDTVIKILRHNGDEAITKQGAEALSIVDTEGVKTYKDLQQRIRKATDDYKEKVNLELEKDTKPYKASEVPKNRVSFPEKIQNPDGTTTVKLTTDFENPLSTALDDLKSYYVKTRQADKAQNIINIQQKIKDVGLTKREINDIAREYKTDFLNKAYPKGYFNVDNKIIVKHEMTRRALKDFARSGLTEGAKKLDETYSKLITTLDEVSSNVEKVAREKALTESGLIGIGGKAIGAVRHPLRTGANYILEEPSHINIVKSEKKLSKNLRKLKKQMMPQVTPVTPTRLPKSPYTLRNVKNIQGIE